MKFSTFMKIARKGDVMLAAVNAGLQKPSRAQVASIATKLAKFQTKDGKQLTVAQIAHTIQKAANPNMTVNQWGAVVYRTAVAA